MPSFGGTIRSGCKDAGNGWNWASIKIVLGDVAIHSGTINVELDDYDNFRFVADIPFPNHKRPDGRCEGISFQRCRLRVGDVESHAYVAKTNRDYWGDQRTIEVIAPFIEGPLGGAQAEIILSN
jgi:hypothetical protein